MAQRRQRQRSRRPKSRADAAKRRHGDPEARGRHDSRSEGAFRGPRGVSGGHRSTIVFVALISVLLFVTYSFSLSNQFVYDDRFLIVESQLVQDLNNAPRAFDVQFYSGLNYYRPLTLISFMIEYRLWGGNPFGFHLTNALLIVAVALMLYFMACEILGATRKPLAFLVALCFALHPIVTSVVMPLGARGDLLSLLFLFCAYLLFIRRSRPDIVLAPLFFGLALLSKETAVTFPAVLLAMDLLIIRRSGRSTAQGSLLSRHLPFWAVMVAYVVVRFLVLPGVASELTFDLPTFLKSYLYLAQTCLIPTIGLVYEPMFGDWFSPFKSAVLAAVIAATIAAVRFSQPGTRREAAFWLAWVIITFLPTSNIVGQETVFDERYLALPLVGIVSFYGVLIYSLGGGRRDIRIGKVALSVAIVAAFITISVGRTKFWKDDVTFFTEWQKASPSNPRPPNHLGLILWDMNNTEAAMDYFLLAARLDPNYVLAHNNLGLLNLKLGRLDEAEKHLRRAVGVDQWYAPACFNLGTVLEARGSFEEALPFFEQAARIDPTWAEAHYRAGRIHEKAGRLNLAADCYERAIEHEPGFADAYFGLSSVYEQMGLPGRSEEYLHEGLKYSSQGHDAEDKQSPRPTH